MRTLLEAIPEMTEEDKHLIESSDQYLAFFKRSTRFMERALAHQIDLFTEYSSQVEEERCISRATL